MANIYLVGFMGTGKTAVGNEVARRLNQQFIDLDSQIEERENRKISQIFNVDGEAYFRSLEKQALKEIAAEKNRVVSCGGGIILDEENIQIMKKTGRMICLTSRPEVILARTQGYRQRPLLNVENPAERIDELLKIRAPFYAQADYTIDTSDLSVLAVVDKVLEYVRGKNN
ncbi:MAG: shikimate kinase [Candidatus Omnitrophota bacterium]|jgi:shikimate kinase